MNPRCRDAVLVSWVAVNNDPFERERGSRNYRTVDGVQVPGPTLTLLFDNDSQLAGKVGDVVLLHRDLGDERSANERQVVADTAAAIRERDPQIRIQAIPWAGADPTDHREIYRFVQPTVRTIRQRFPGRELVVHVSPGTPSMQTVWVLMGETGLVEAPYALVQSYKPADRRGRPAVAPVDVGIDTFYKAYIAGAAVRAANEEENVSWDPQRFRSRLLIDVYREATRFARLNVPILLLGERGTGKTTLARWIRLASPFKRPELDRRWAAVACGQYTTETMRSELFGYKKGAFTGAFQDREGLLALANRDTLFLDEIGDISRDLQRLLIKAVEEHSYYALGDDKPRQSAFRLISATNVPISELGQRLTPDFMDRIGQVRICLPPLRDIPEDLPWIWQEVYSLAIFRAGVQPKDAKIGAEQHERIVKDLASRSLPGNLRDLFTVAYRLLAAVADPLAPLPMKEAVDYATAGLGQTAPASASGARAIARSFADLAPLDGIVSAENPAATKALEAHLKRYLALELRRISRRTGSRIEDLCDVTERSVRKWADGKYSSGESED